MDTITLTCERLYYESTQLKLKILYIVSAIYECHNSNSTLIFLTEVKTIRF